MGTKNNKMLLCSNNVGSYEVREETLNGRTYKVVPVTMMVEGVHPGSHGPLLHTAAELGKVPGSWNGIPVVINHPQVDGNYVSANSPTVLEQWAIGTVFNTSMEGTKLKSEAWLDKEKLALNENLNARIDNGEVIEVSVGVFSEDVEEEGTWNNEAYIGIATNLRPDHLAILPNLTGACSNEDGCGIRVNQNNMQVNEANLTTVLQQLKLKGFAVEELTVNESLQETMEKVRSCIYAKDNENEFYFIEDVWPDYVVYRKSERATNTNTMYKQTYAITANGNVELIGAPVVVRKKVEYEVVPTTNTKRTRRLNNFKKEDEMANETCSPCVLKRVNSLIANTATRFTEDDREWLEGLAVPQLDQLKPMEQAEPTVNKEVAVNEFKAGLKTDDDYIALMPEEMQTRVKAGLKVNADKKAKLVEDIMANTNDTWTKEELEAYSTEKLEKIAKTAGIAADAPQVNYAGMGAGNLNVNNAQDCDVPVLLPAGVKEQ